MSDDSFDDSLLEDYNEEKGGVYEYDDYDEGKTKRESKLMLGLAIGIGITLVLELGVGLALDVQTNLVHRYIAYMLGLIPIFVTAIYTRSILKMFFIGAPVLIVTSFALPFFLPNIFSGLMTPFLTLIPIVQDANSILSELGVVDPSMQVFVEPILQYGIALDFFFGIFVGLFAAIGITGVVKMVSQKPGILTIFTFIFSMVFFVIGVIILPYFLVITSGIAHFGMAFSVGGAYLTQGTQISNDPNGDLSLADDYFAKAQEWFEQAEQMLEGLQAMGLFGLMGSIDPTIKTIVSNGIVLMNAAVDLAKGVAPALAGFGAMSRGMEQAMQTLDNTTASAQALVLSDSDNPEFQEGLDLIERGFYNFSQSVPNIQEALNTIENDINRAELEQALAAQNVDVSEVLNTVFSAIPLLKTTLDIFTNDAGTGLIDDPDTIDVDVQRAPIVHLLLGAQAMTQAQETIGESSNFEGTGDTFKDLIYHLNFVISSLDPANNDGIQRLNDLELDPNAPEVIVDLKTNIEGSVAFMNNAGNTTISIGQFGIIASPTLTNMNQTLTVLTGAEDFTNITAAQYDEAISVFDGSNTNVSTGIVANATSMQSIATSTRAKIDFMDNASGNQTYGFFNDPASEFVKQFRKFDLLKNANNFYSIATGFSSLLKGMKDLANVDIRIGFIEANVTLIETEINAASADIGATNYTQAAAHVQTANSSVQLVQQELIDTNTTLQVAKLHIVNASTSLNATVDMPQMESTADALARISKKMTNIQVGNGTQGLTGISNEMQAMETSIQDLYDAAIANDSGTANTEISQILTNISNIQDEIVYIQGEFTGIQSDLGDVSISA